MRTSLFAVALIAASQVAPASAQRATPAAMDSLLERLVGTWDMIGNVRGKPVTYRLESSRALHGRFVEMHLTELAQPSTYEARVFLGVDSAGGRYIAHWIDNTGAANSIPHAVGEMRGDTIQFTFAYADSPFRDTFSFDRAKAEWHFLLESGVPGGGWKLFGDYRVERRHGR